MSKGLSLSEARKRLEKYGPNEIKEKRRFAALDILKRQFSSMGGSL